MNPFSNWNQADVFSHNERVRMKAVKSSSGLGASPGKSPCSDSEASTPRKGVRPGKRIRQSDKPSLNKLEQEWFDILKASNWMKHLRPQARRYELGNGIWYKPDVVGFDTRDGRETAYEVKGPHAFRGGFENLKFAARVWPEVVWILVWKESGEWKQQLVLP